MAKKNTSPHSSADSSKPTGKRPAAKKKTKKYYRKEQIKGMGLKYEVDKILEYQLIDLVPHFLIRWKVTEDGERFEDSWVNENKCYNIRTRIAYFRKHKLNAKPKKTKARFVELNEETRKKMMEARRARCSDKKFTLDFYANNILKEIQ